MDGSSQQEIERKYDVDSDAVIPEFAGLDTSAGPLSAGDPRTFQLRAEYFDTTERDLARAGIAVRRREGGHDAGWHIKARTALGKFENQWPLEAASADSAVVPDAVRAELSRRVPGSELSLETIARLDTERIIVVLADSEGLPLVEIADDRVTAHDTRRGVTQSWREWEAELLPRAPLGNAGEALLDLVEERLRAAGAATAASDSKIGRALGTA